MFPLAASSAMQGAAATGAGNSALLFGGAMSQAQHSVGVHSSANTQVPLQRGRPDSRSTERGGRTPRFVPQQGQAKPEGHKSVFTPGAGGIEISPDPTGGLNDRDKALISGPTITVPTDAPKQHALPGTRLGPDPKLASGTPGFPAHQEEKTGPGTSTGGMPEHITKPSDLIYHAEKADGDLIIGEAQIKNATDGMKVAKKVFADKVDQTAVSDLLIKGVPFEKAIMQVAAQPGQYLSPLLGDTKTTIDGTVTWDTRPGGPANRVEFPQEQAVKTGMGVVSYLKEQSPYHFINLAHFNNTTQNALVSNRVPLDWEQRMLLEEFERSGGKEVREALTNTHYTDPVEAITTISHALQQYSLHGALNGGVVQLELAARIDIHKDGTIEPLPYLGIGQPTDCIAPQHPSLSHVKHSIIVHVHPAGVLGLSAADMNYTKSQLDKQSNSGNSLQSVSIASVDNAGRIVLSSIEKDGRQGFGVFQTREPLLGFPNKISIGRGGLHLDRINSSVRQVDLGGTFYSPKLDDVTRAEYPTKKVQPDDALMKEFYLYKGYQVVGDGVTPYSGRPFEILEKESAPKKNQ